jgi:hypothetical protein
MDKSVMLCVERSTRRGGRRLHVARGTRTTRKKRSGWKHPLDINRNHRRWEKRRRSASACARHALEVVREMEVWQELREGRVMFQGAGAPVAFA